MTQENPTNVAAESPSEYNGIMITATPEFKAALKAAAEKSGASLSSFARKVLSEAISYDGPLQKETNRVRKYQSEEERAEAQKTRNKARRDVIKALLEKYGSENVNAEVEARVAALTETVPTEEDGYEDDEGTNPDPESDEDEDDTESDE